MNYWFLYNLQNGDIKDNTASPYHGDATEYTNIPNGYGVIGPIAGTDTIAQDAFDKPTEYTVQNGQLVHSNAPTAQQQLANAKSAKKAELYQAWQNACLTFQSSALGTIHTYTNDDKAIGRYNAIMNRILKDSAYVPPPIYTHEVGFVAHTVAQFTQVFDDGMTDEQAKAQKYEQKCTDVDNATTIDFVNAITF